MKKAKGFASRKALVPPRSGGISAGILRVASGSFQFHAGLVSVLAWGLAGLGLILTLGVACSMLSALVFLPAVLHLMGGRTATEAPPIAEEPRLAA
jgi:hypothetical protein